MEKANASTKKTGGIDQLRKRQRGFGNQSGAVGKGGPSTISTPNATSKKQPLKGYLNFQIKLDDLPSSSEGFRMEINGNVLSFSKKLSNDDEPSSSSMAAEAVTGMDEQISLQREDNNGIDYDNESLANQFDVKEVYGIPAMPVEPKKKKYSAKQRRRMILSGHQPNDQNEKAFLALDPATQKVLREMKPQMHYIEMKDYLEINKQLATLYKTNWKPWACALCAHLGKVIEKFSNEPFHQFSSQRNFEIHYERKHCRPVYCPICGLECSDAKTLKGHHDHMKSTPNQLHYENDHGGY